MKKLIAMILLIGLLVPVTSSADSDYFLFQRYTNYIDGDFYNSFFNSNFAFDIRIMDVYLYNDFKSASICCQLWTDGKYESTGMEECSFKIENDKITIIPPDNIPIVGYWDENEDDLWLDFGSGYFRFSQAHQFNIQKDWETNK